LSSFILALINPPWIRFVSNGIGVIIYSSETVGICVNATGKADYIKLESVIVKDVLLTYMKLNIELLEESEKVDLFIKTVPK
jgi:hypothetical protein